MEDKTEFELDDPDMLALDTMVPFRRMCEMEGIHKTQGHERIANGEYTVYRDGTRKLLISMRSILARRKRVLRKVERGSAGASIGSPRSAAKRDQREPRPRKHQP